MIWTIPTGLLSVTLVGTRTGTEEHEVVVNSSYPFGPGRANEKPELAVVLGPFCQGHSAQASCIPG